MDQLELLNVKKVYDIIAESFDITRENRIWSNVEQFISKNISNSYRILDYGCGNGKYISLFDLDIHEYHAFDNCERFIKLINKKYPKVKTKVGDICQNNYQSEYFDFIICIAVIHHLSTFDRRVQMIVEIINMLKINGTALITAWTTDIGFNIPFDKFKHQSNKIFKKSVKINDDNDYMIPFSHNNINYNRYYHLFNYNDFIDIIDVAKKIITNHQITIVDYYYESNNYCIIIKKNM